MWAIKGSNGKFYTGPKRTPALFADKDFPEKLTEGMNNLRVRDKETGRYIRNPIQWNVVEVVLQEVDNG